MTNETYSINYLRWYYDATPVVIRVVSFSQYLGQLKGRSPTFMENFGGVAKKLNVSKVKDALEKMGRNASRLEYMPSPYFEAIATDGTALNFGDVAAAAGQGVLEAGEKLTSLASTSLMIYAGIAAFGLYVLPKLMKGK